MSEIGVIQRTVTGPQPDIAIHWMDGQFNAPIDKALKEIRVWAQYGYNVLEGDPDTNGVRLPQETLNVFKEYVEWLQSVPVSGSDQLWKYLLI